MIKVSPSTKRREATRYRELREQRDALLEALRELVAEADEHPGWEGHPNADSYGFQLARAAIAKATGEQA